MLTLFSCTYSLEKYNTSESYTFFFEMKINKFEKPRESPK